MNIDIVNDILQTAETRFICVVPDTIPEFLVCDVISLRLLVTWFRQQS